MVEKKTGRRINCSSIASTFATAAVENAEGAGAADTGMNLQPSSPSLQAHVDGSALADLQSGRLDGIQNAVLDDDPAGVHGDGDGSGIGAYAHVAGVVVEAPCDCRMAPVHVREGGEEGCLTEAHREMLEPSTGLPHTSKFASCKF